MLQEKLKLTEKEQKALDAAQKEYDKRFQICLDQQCIRIQDAIIELQRQRAKVEDFGPLGNSYMNCLERCQKKDRYILGDVEKLLERSEVRSDLLEMQSTGEISAALEYWDKVKSDIAL
ncbi:hypothetical protein M513_04911 [Trichuris suis]|uniref:Uncharacterized protein n=1 Tax=Trichuris suis TaxID=68888 RepID=A0A085MA88_9BILA|nr:hypothetical protein M513_04911 [Trichuris suis]